MHERHGPGRRLRYLGRHMNLPRSLVATLALGSGLWLGCYSERLASSTYRYPCDSEADCHSNEICRRGLCERPCTQATAAEDCLSEDGYAACFNGVCANTCEVGSGNCAKGQTCFDLGLDLGGGGGSPFGGGSSAALGICGIECDAGDNADICPEGEICIPDFGTCAQLCTLDEECGSGYTCFFGVCAPEGTSELPSGSTGDAGTGDGSTGAAAPSEQQER